ncbi:hypothetical protein [Streptomyces sp. NPDC051577]|uniref:hypothetical protein n=1 Tax=Streptomyces sp. NPDC051577 TaxID=3155166 RepID=UPI0034421AB6
MDSNKDAFGEGNDETLNGFNADAQGDIEVYVALFASCGIRHTFREGDQRRSATVTSRHLGAWCGVMTS